MIELLGMLGGAVFRLLPEIFKFLNAKRDAEHEFRMTELQLRIDQARAGQRIDELHAQGAIAADAGELQAMVEALKMQGTSTGVPRIDALNASVRPVLTYWWCLGLYTVAKGITIAVAIGAGTDLASFAAIACTEFDRAVIGSIFAFWFVDRSLRKR